MSALDREHLRRELRQEGEAAGVEPFIDGLNVYDEDKFLDWMLHRIKLSFVAGVNHGVGIEHRRNDPNLDGDELRRFLVERGGKR